MGGLSLAVLGSFALPAPQLVAGALRAQPAYADEYVGKDAVALLVAALAADTSPTQAEVNKVAEAYAALSPADQESMSDAYVKAMAGAQAIVDREAAAAVSVQAASISASSAPTTVQLEALELAYSKLTSSQQSLVTGYEAAVSYAGRVIDQAAADADAVAAKSVQVKLDNLLWTAEPTRDQVAEAVDAYRALTEAQKDLVTGYQRTIEAAYAKIEAAEADAARALADAETAGPVQQAVDALAKSTAPTFDEIQAVRDAYLSLTDSQKALVSGYFTTIAAADERARAAADDSAAKEARADAAAAAKVSALLDELASGPTQAGVDSAVRAYALLTDGQKSLVPEYATIIAAAQRAVDQAAAKAVQEQVVRLAGVSEPRQRPIDAVRDAYISLSQDQKRLVTDFGKVIAAAQKRHDEAHVVTTLVVNARKVTAAEVAAAIARKSGPDSIVSAKTVSRVVIGKNVREIAKGAFKKLKSASQVNVKSKKLSRARVRGSLKGSRVLLVKVVVAGSKKTRDKYAKKYAKAFAKKNSGKKVDVR